MRLLAALLFLACTQCPAPSPPVAPPPPTALDGGSLHLYKCPIGDAGAAWTCQDGLTVPFGTCSQYGCVPQ
jgi:hypothetical protein